jgi:hypothetical protein
MFAIIKRWPFTTWWLLGILTGIIWLIADAVIGIGYDDGGIGSALMIISLFTGIPINLTREIILMLLGSGVVTPAINTTVVVLSYVICATIDRFVLHRLFCKRTNNRATAE